MVLRQQFCENESKKKKPNTLRLMKAGDEKNLKVKSPEINLNKHKKKTGPLPYIIYKKLTQNRLKS